MTVINYQVLKVFLASFKEPEVIFRSGVIIVPVFAYFQYTGKIPSEQFEQFYSNY